LLKSGDICATDADTIIVNLFAGVTAPAGATGAVDAKLDGQIAKVARLGDLSGRANKVLTLYPGPELAADRVVVVGLGDAAKFSSEAAAEAAAAGVAAAAEAGSKHAAIIAFGAGIGGLSPAEAAEATILGARLAVYKFDKYKTIRGDDDANGELETLALVEFDPANLDELTRGMAAGNAIADGVILARNLQNAPPNDMTPGAIAAAAREMSGREGLDCSTMDQAQMRAAGMGSLLAVAQGSDQPPFLITMVYEPEGPASGTLAVVGKGVSFDTGGISIKPSARMEEMKFDMSGAAATIGTMLAVARLKPSLKVVGVVPTVENMPSGRALRPSDVVTASNGKTVEIVSTDAEGRMILADALCHAQSFEPDAIVDMATLTGAVIVALGHFATGMMVTSPELARRLSRAGDRVNERVWELPLWDEYEENIKAKTGDLDNTGGRAAGTINGGMFLKHFAGDYPFAHLDIAGTAWEGKKTPLWRGGGKGVGVRLITQLVRDWPGPIAGDATPAQ
jgi:leucyl aminopeptidase